MTKLVKTKSANGIPAYKRAFVDCGMCSEQILGDTVRGAQAEAFRLGWRTYITDAEDAVPRHKAVCPRCQAGVFGETERG